MKYLKMVTLGMVAAIACCLGASAAFAEGGPLFGYCTSATGGRYVSNDCETLGSGTGEAFLLQSGQSLRVLASALNLQLLRVPTNAAELIACTNLSLNSTAYLEGGMPGKDGETITYSGCVTPSDPSCQVTSVGETTTGNIATLALESELVYLESATGAKELNPDKSGTLFKPATSSTETFAVIELKPSGSCPSGGTPAIKGLAILENDEPLVPQLLKTLLAPATAIAKYFAGMTGEEKTIKKLEFAGLASTYSGKVSIDVTLLGSSWRLPWWICP